MKFRCERDTLIGGLATVVRALGRGPQIPALAGVQMVISGNVAMLTCTDLDLTITTKITGSDLLGTAEGTVVPPAKLLADIVKTLDPGAVELEADGDELRVASGRVQFSLRMFPSEDFPRLPEPSGSTVMMPAGDFQVALQQVTPSASEEQTRPILTGVVIIAEDDGLCVAATDSYRLAERRLPGVCPPGMSRMLVPARALAETSKLIGHADEIAVMIGAGNCAFEVNGVTLISRLLEGEYPNYRALLPSDQPNRLTVNVEQLQDAIKRCRTMSDKPTVPIRLALREDAIDLSLVSLDRGAATETVDASYDGEAMTIGLNPKFLLDGLDACGSEQVTLGLTTAAKPVLMTPADGGDFRYLMMPITIT